jgi:hypothetical protein
MLKKASAGKALGTVKKDLINRRVRKGKSMSLSSLRSLRKSLATFAVNGFLLFKHPLTYRLLIR